MKSIKFMLSALLLTVSMGAFAQVEEDIDLTSGDETAAAVTNPDMPGLYHRVYGGFSGVFEKYNYQGYSPDYKNHFMKGVTIGWAGGIHIAKKVPLYLEVGAELAFHAGAAKGDSIRIYEDNGDQEKRHYSVTALSLNIPVNFTYRFNNVCKPGLTLAPYIGAHARFNLLAKRKETLTYTNNATGAVTETTQNLTLLSADRTGDSWFESTLHQGNLCQFGAQIGVNAIYKKWTLGLAYSRDITPFAEHKSNSGITQSRKDNDNVKNEAGTGCDYKITTDNAFSVTVGYIF